MNHIKDSLIDRWTLPVFLLFIIITFLILLRLIQTIGTALPEGLGITDPLITVWILSWDLHKFKTGVSGFFDANIFFPYKNTLAYSEHLIGVAVFAYPLTFFTKNRVLIHNIMFLGSFVLSGFGMYLLSRHLIVDVLSSIVAGIIFAYFPYHFIHTPRIQLESMQWIPFTLLFLHRFSEKMDYRNIALAAVFFLLTFLSCLYYGVFLSFFIIFFFIWHLTRKKFFVAPVLWKLGLFLIISAVLIPIHLPYLEAGREINLARSVWDNMAYSADISSYASAPESNMLWGSVLLKNNQAENSAVFFGFMPVILSLACIFLVSRRTGDSPKDKRYIWFYLAIVVTSVVLSFGPVIQFNGKEVVKGPYLLLYEYFPGFNGIRAPNRISVFAALGIAVLAGFGIKFIKERIGNAFLKRAVAVLFAVIIIIEFLPSRLNTIPVSGYDDMPPVYRWLSESAEDWPVLEYPMAEPQYDEAWYMYYSIFHWKRIVNGSSGFTPPVYRQMADEMKTFPSGDSIEFLKALGVKYIIVHTEKLKAPIKDISTIPDTVLLKRFEKDLVFEISRDTDVR